MKRKWWIVGALLLLELLVCGGILLTMWAGRTAFEGVRFFYVTDTHVEETLEETFVVDGPAVLDLEADFGDVTVTNRHDTGLLVDTATGPSVSFGSVSIDNPNNAGGVGILVKKLVVPLVEFQELPGLEGLPPLAVLCVPPDRL